MTRAILRTSLAATLLVLACVASPLTHAEAGPECPPASDANAGEVPILQGHLCAPDPKQAKVIAEFIWNYAIDAGLIVKVGNAYVPWAMDLHDWGLVAQCESGGRWDLDTRPFSGGLQILESTWVRSGGLEFASRPALASAGDQLTVARRILDRSGPGQWPVCSKRAGWR
jgi:transglycosylase-like protein